MAKKAKAFSKIFKAGEVKKSLLTEEDADDTFPDPEDRSDTEDDFPLEPASRGDGFLQPGAFEGLSTEFSTAAADAFESAEFRAFEEDEEEEEEAVEHSGAEDNSHVDWVGEGAFDKDNNAEFNASFSGLNDVSAKEDSTATTTTEVKSKGKRRLTKLFKRKDDKKDDAPVARCGEIVVDKSKIPAKKCEMVMLDGKLVAVGGDKNLDINNNRVEEEDKRSKFKALKNTVGNLKKKVANGLKMDDVSSKDNIAEEDPDEGTNKDNSEENRNEDDEDVKDDDMSRSRQSRRRRGEGESSSRRSATAGDRDTQRRRRRESRIELQKGGGAPSSRNSGSMVDGSRRRRPSEESDHKPRRSRTGSDAGRQTVEEDGKLRRSRTNNSEASSGGSRRRPSQLVDKHSGSSQNSPHRGTAKPKMEGALDDSNRNSGRNKTLDESHTRRGGDIGESSAGKRISRRKESEMDGSAKERRGSREDNMIDGSRRRREMGARRESRRQLVRKTLSGDDAKKADPLSSSDHHAFRRANTDTPVIKFQRAQSTRHFGRNDLMGSDSDKNRGVGLSDRERLRRATWKVEGENKNDKSNKMQTLGALYGRGGNNRENCSQSEEQDKQERTSLAGFSGDNNVLEKTLEEGEDEDQTERDEDPSNKPDVIVEESDEEEKDDSEDDDEESLEEGNRTYLPSENLTSNDIDRLVKAMARKAKGAKKDGDDLEDFLMDSLHKSTSLMDLVGDDMSIDSDPDSDLDDVTEEADNHTQVAANRRNLLRERTRSYVNVFLASKGGFQRAKSMWIVNEVSAKLEKIPEGDRRETKTTESGDFSGENSRVANQVAAQLGMLEAVKTIDQDSKHSTSAEKRPSTFVDLSGAVSKIASATVEVKSESNERDTMDADKRPTSVADLSGAVSKIAGGGIDVEADMKQCGAKPSDKLPSAGTDLCGAVSKIAAGTIAGEPGNKEKAGKADRKSSSKSKASRKKSDASKTTKASEKRSSTSSRRHKDDDSLDPSVRMSWERSTKLSTKVESAKAKASDSENVNKVDFSEGTSKLEARKEAKAKSRVKNPVVVAK